MKHQLIILLILAFGLNINTIFNEYAVDDVVIFTENSLIKKGIKGIPDILTHGIYYGSDGVGDSGLSGGRYRPVAMIVFSLEYQFFGTNPVISHLINVLLFVLLIALLYKLLYYFFREQHPYLTFITCLLFVVHPIHTEVIANVKSRDELMVFILLILTSFSIIKYFEKKSIGIFFLGLLFFLLALLTRENAVPFILIAPLVAYYFFNLSLKKSIFLAFPLFAVFVIYFIIRTSLVGFAQPSYSGILNSPFMYASATEAFATKVFILLKYIWLLVFPYPLSCDYGFNQIPYIDLSSSKFIFSSIILLVLITYAVCTFKKKSIYSFCILYFLISIFLFANFVVDIGAPLAERLLFQPSLAFCIALAALYLKTSRKFNLLAKCILIVLLVLFSVKTFLRNAEWKNNETLYSADVLSAPNSIRTNICAAKNNLIKAKAETNLELKAEYLKNVIFYNERILNIYSNDRNIYDDLGYSYFELGDYSKAANYWLKSFYLDPTDSETKKRIEKLSDFIFNLGNKAYKSCDFNAAINWYAKSVELNENNVDAWYNLSKSYLLIHDTLNANATWQILLQVRQKNK